MTADTPLVTQGVVTYVCPIKDIVCGNAPERWCNECPLRKRAARPSPPPTGELAELLARLDRIQHSPVCPGRFPNDFGELGHCYCDKAVAIAAATFLRALVQERAALVAEVATMREEVTRLSGSMCLICGRSQPCDVAPEACTFDPHPVEAAQRFLQRAQAAEADLATMREASAGKDETINDWRSLALLLTVERNQARAALAVAKKQADDAAGEIERYRDDVQRIIRTNIALCIGRMRKGTPPTSDICANALAETGNAIRVQIHALDAAIAQKRSHGGDSI